MTPEAIKLLQAPLDRSNVRQRTQSGRSLSYIEGWHAIAEANRIFGFDGWSRETIYLKEVCRYEAKSSKGGTNWKVGYEAKVAVTIGGVTREGSGYGQGTMGDLFDAMESAGKEAETDAMKRALMTFGNQFGLALYDKEQTNVSDRPDPAEERSKQKVAEIVQALAPLNPFEQAQWLLENPKQKEALHWVKQHYPHLLAELEGLGVSV